MNLDETVRALEAKGVLIALNLGEHGRCAIDSNCPTAIKLRKLIGEAGVTLPELLEGYEETKPTDPIKYEFPKFDGKMVLEIGGKVVEVELEDVITGELKIRVQNKLAMIKQKETTLRSFGRSLYGNYQIHLEKALQSTTLPQLKFPLEELIKANCYITQDGAGTNNSYMFLFPFKYSPEYMARNGKRYKIKPADQKLCVRDVFIQLVISAKGKFFQPRLVYSDGSYLNHYHGSGGGNCWGGVRLPQCWDGTLRNVVAVAKTLEGSLKTVNINSMANQHPTDMPDGLDLFKEGTLIGREGSLSEDDSEMGMGDRYNEGGTRQMHTTDVHGIAHVRAGWGRRT